MNEFKVKIYFWVLDSNSKYVVATTDEQSAIDLASEINGDVVVRNHYPLKNVDMSGWITNPGAKRAKRCRNS